MTSYHFARALLGDTVRDHVTVTVEQGRFASVSYDAHARPGAIGGLALPGFANTHSHAFHRALRGRTQVGPGTFWTWRDQMYSLAATLTPDSYRELATAAYREMVLAGWTSVGEFHYLHHQPDGRPYADPREMSHALREAATTAGIRLALLDTCYLAAGFGAPPEGAQIRYSDGDPDTWAQRSADADGVAIHSVRAVPAEAIDVVAEAAGTRPLHVHLSEQAAENEQCLAATGLTPTALLAKHGAITEHTTAVHATHLTEDDIETMGRARASASFCPTTERDLGDGVGPGRALANAGVRITLGSDSQAVVDPFEEMRALEMDERLATQRRGHWTAADLLRAGAGHASLGQEGGTIAVGLPADLVVVDTDSPRTAGTGAGVETAAFAASAADVTAVMVNGGWAVEPGTMREHAEECGAQLGKAIRRVWEETQ